MKLNPKFTAVASLLAAAVTQAWVDSLSAHLMKIEVSPRRIRKMAALVWAIIIIGLSRQFSAISRSCVSPPIMPRIIGPSNVRTSLARLRSPAMTPTNESGQESVISPHQTWPHQVLWNAWCLSTQ